LEGGGAGVDEIKNGGAGLAKMEGRDGTLGQKEKKRVG
jgi:hypothetical protein